MRPDTELLMNTEIIELQYGKNWARLYRADCLDLLLTLEAQSIDAILTDLPYGTTACSWDIIIPFAPMWKAVRHVLKPRGVFVTTASQPFTSLLVASNLAWFKYCWVWDKHLPIGFLDANRKPLKRHEDIAVFSENGHAYNPQKTAGKPYHKGKRALTPSYGAYVCLEGHNESGDRFPTTIIDISNADRNKDGHPTQKPVALYEYLARTYTSEGDMILDFCMGSGTTGLAALKLHRNFIGVEIDRHWFDVARKRLEGFTAQPELPLEEVMEDIHPISLDFFT